eukprot:3693835-Alexandrium_andersonii.AAC.1
MGGPQQRGRNSAERPEPLCGQGCSLLQGRLHVRGHTPLGSFAATAAGLCNPAPWPCGRPEARGPKGSHDRRTQGALARA